MVRSSLVVALIVAVLTALTVFALIEVGDRTGSVVAEVEAEGQVTARAVATLVDRWFFEVGSACSEVAGRLVGWQPQLVGQARSALLVLPRPLSYAYVIDRTGRSIAASPSAAILVDQVRHPVAVGSGVGGSATLGAETDPLLQAEVTGVSIGMGEGSRLVCLTQLRSDHAAGSVGELAASLPSREGVQVHLIAPTPKGHLVVSADPNGPLLQGVSQDLTTPIRRASSNRTGSTSFRGEAGRELLASFATGKSGWLAIVVRPQRDVETATAGSVSASRLLIAMIGLVAISFVLLSVAASRRNRREVERLKRAFLAIAGHELRTPLTVIRGFSHTLSSRWDRVGEDRKVEIIKTIGRHARSLEHLVERLLLGAQLEAGWGTPANVVPTDVVPVVQKVIEHHEAMTALHRFELRGPEIAEAQVDPKLFEQVMTHLVENAVRYSPGGGAVTLTVEAKRSRVEVIVEDEGVGLPSDTSSIFEKFVQGEDVDTRTHDEGGVGLGLFIVRTHLDRMGGQVRAERREHKGARFVVSVPR